MIASVGRRFALPVLALCGASGICLAGDLTPPPGPVAPTAKPLTDVEPRTAVNTENTPGDASASFVIAQPGSYYLTGNLQADAAKDAIHISTNNVTLDLNGFTIDGTGSAGAGAISITDSYIGITITNGNISNWPNEGIHGEDAAELTIRSVRFADLGDYGVLVGAARCVDCAFYRCDGAFAASSDATLERALIEECTGQTVSVGSRAVVRDCTLRDCGTFGIRVSGGDAVIEGNTVLDTSNIGIQVAFGSGTIVRGNTVRGGAVGLLATSGGNTFSGNTVGGNIVNYDFGGGNDLNLVLSEIPQSIDWPAYVTIAGSLTGAAGQDGISINSDDVTVDLGGHALVGVAGSLDGVADAGAFSGLIVKNGTVRGWGNFGIGLGASSGSLVEDIRAEDNANRGFTSGTGTTFRRCIARDNPGFGFTAGNSCTITECQAINNAFNGIGTGVGSTVLNCTAYLNGQQGIQVSLGSTVIGCSTYQNTLNGIVSSLGSTIVDCSARSNGFSGITATAGSIVERCTVSLNGTVGIWASEGTMIRNNSCINHAAGRGIWVTGDYARIEGNHCSENNTGIEVTGTDNFLARNTCSTNTTNWDVAAGNICLVVGATPTGVAFSGDSGGVAPGSTDPNANFSH